MDVIEAYRVACAYELVDVDGDVARFLRAAVDRCVGHCNIFHCVSALSSMMKEGGRRDGVKFDGELVRKSRSDGGEGMNFDQEIRGVPACLLFRITPVGPKRLTKF